MKKTFLASILAVAACTAPAFGEEFTGNMELGGVFSDIQGDKAKFNEYRDIGEGITGNFLLDYYGKDYFLNFKGERFGYNADTQKTLNDQSFEFSIGRPEDFKYSIFYNETPHNLTFGAKSIYSGVGSTALTAPVANNASYATAYATIVNSTPFDYTIDRKNYGGEMEFSFKSPFFLNARFEKIETDGLLPLGTYLGQQKELPAPISYSTENVYLTAGYRSNNLIVTLDGTISDFTNSDKTFSHTYTGPSTATVYLAPDSMYYKVGGNVMYRIPFWNTTFMARASYSESSNDISLTEGTNTIGGTFSGKITYKTAYAAVTSSPIKALDVKAYLNLLDKTNKSPTGFVYGSALAADAATNTTEKFDYNKVNGGLDVGYKLPANTKLAAGYEYLRINRLMNFHIFGTTYMGARTDAPQTNDHIFYTQLKNNYFDWMSAKVRYQYLTRSSDFRGDLYATATDASFFKQWWRPVDTADKNQHSVKLGVEFEPTDSLSFTTEYSFKMNDYVDTDFGMLDDSRHEVYADATYSKSNFSINPYVEFEMSKNESQHRNYTAFTNADPNLVDTATAYNWNSKRKDVSYAIGVNGNIDIIKKKLVLSTGYRYEDASGDQDFSSGYDLTSLATPIVSNDNVDNYKKHALAAKLNYSITKNLELGLGYLFEKLDYTDDHYTGYDYMITKTDGVMLTGAYANPDYDAHIGYVTVGYKF